MLRYRLIFGTLMIAAAVGLFYLDDRLDDVRLSGWMRDVAMGRDYPPAGLVLLGVVMGVVVLGARELSRLFHAKGVRVGAAMLSVAGIVGVLTPYATPFRLDSQATLAIYTTCIVGVFGLALLVYSRRHDPRGAMTAASASLLALIYLGTMPGFLIAIRRWHSAWVVVGIILIIKASDIGAYFAGRAVGRHKLIPWLSPGKTWEGLLGGVGLSALVAVGLVALSNELGVSGRYVYNDTLTTRRFETSAYPLWLASGACWTWSIRCCWPPPRLTGSSASCTRSDNRRGERRRSRRLAIRESGDAGRGGPAAPRLPVPRSHACLCLFFLIIA